MNEAKPGARLAGRYRLVERLSVSPDESTWRAVDSTLDRTVVVWILRPGHPFADDVLDAARRVALIDDKRLIKVLDVGTDSGANGDRAYVVNEASDGETLESMVQRRPLTAIAARRIAGETAEGLAAAAARGLHHLKLTPRTVMVTSKGLIKISGLAVEAAAGGLDPGHATRANRTDATALAGLLYSALTGRWPLGDAGFPPAPRTSAGVPVPAGDLVPGVPDDLNALLVRGLGDGDDGPQKPADVALELTPWSSSSQADLIGRSAAGTKGETRPATPAGGTAAPAAAKTPAGSSAVGSSAAGSTAAALPIRPAGLKPAASSAPASSAPASSAPAASAAATSAAATAPAKTATPAAGAPAAGASARPGSGARPAARPAAGHRPPTRPQPAERPGDARFRPSPPVMPPPMTAPGTPRGGPAAPPLRPGLGPAPLPPPGPDARAGSGAGPAPSRAPGPVPGTSSGAGESLFESNTSRPNTVHPNPASPNTARPDAPRPKKPRPGTSRPNGVRPDAPARSNNPTNSPRNSPRNTPANGSRVNGHNSVRSTGEELMPWATSWASSAEAPSALESTGPFPLVLPQVTPPPQQSRRVLLAVVGVLAVVVVIAAFSLRGLISGGDDETIAPGAASATSLAGPTATSAPAPSASTSASTPSSGSANPPVAPQIAAIRAIDPQGDGDENTADSPKAVDGDPSTSWSSQQYNSTSFGGLKKGVGLAIRLKQRTVVSEVSVDLKGSGGRVQLRLGPSSDVTRSKVADTATNDGGTITLEPKGTLKARYVILWFTELPSTNQGNKAEVVEVRVK